MNTGTGFILIVTGLLILYVVITGKLEIIENAFYQIFDIKQTSDNSTIQKVEGGIVTPVPIFIPTDKNITLPEIMIPNYTK